MRQSQLLLLISNSPYKEGLCRLLPASAGGGTFPTLSLQSLCRRLDPYPAVLLGCTYPLLPQGHRPHVTGNTFGARKYPCHSDFGREPFSGLQSFDHLQSPTLTWPPDRSHRSVPRTLSGRAFYTTHRPSGYPTRDVASLHDRHGQLSRLDFHQLDCSLGSCSFPHWAFRSSSPQGIRVRRYGAWIGIAYKPNSLYSLAVGHREHPW